MTAPTSTTHYNDAVEAAIRLRRYEDAAEYFYRLCFSGYIDLADAKAVLSYRRRRSKKFDVALRAHRAWDYFARLAERRPFVKADIASEGCTAADFWVDPRLTLPSWMRHVLINFSPGQALELLENPPVNPMEFWFSPNYDDPNRFPHPEGQGPRVLQLVDLLVGCGHARWLADKLSRCAPRVAFVAAMSGHPVLRAAATEVLGSPHLDRIFGFIERPRLMHKDHGALAQLVRGQGDFLRAAADAISTYSLTFDVHDALVQPMELFAAYGRANAAKLVYLFVLDPSAYPLFAALKDHWTGRGAPPAGGFRHPRGGFTYAEAFHVRAAALACAYKKEPELSGLTNKLMNRIDFYRNGRVEGFVADSRRAVDWVIANHDA